MAAGALAPRAGGPIGEPFDETTGAFAPPVQRLPLAVCIMISAVTPPVNGTAMATIQPEIRFFDVYSAPVEVEAELRVFFRLLLLVFTPPHFTCCTSCRLQIGQR